MFRTKVLKTFINILKSRWKRKLYLDIEHHAPLLRVGDTGDLSSVGAVSAPARLQGPVEGAGR